MIQHPEVQTVWGPNPGGERGFGTNINSSVDGAKIGYGSGRNVVVRDVTEPTRCDVTSGHRTPVKLVKFGRKENSNQVISADDSGQTVLFKYQNGVFEEVKKLIGIGGRIFDISWYPNERGLACVGDSKGKNGRVFTVSGTDQGGINGSKRLTSVDMFFYEDKITSAKLVTGGDDLKLRYYEYSGGFALTQEETTTIKFKQSCNMVRFSPDGNFVAAVGGKQIYVLDANKGYQILAQCTGDKKKDEHTRTIFAVSWNAASNSFVTVSSDKTAKCWNFDGSALGLIGTVPLANKAQFGPPQSDFQVGCAYIGDGMTDTWVCAALCGDLNIISLKGKELVLENTIVAPTSDITGLDIDRSTGSLAVSTAKGEIFLYDNAGVAQRVKGVKDPKKSIGCIHLGDIIFSTGWDDVLCGVKADGMTVLPRKLALNGQPQTIRKGGANSSMLAIATKTEVVIVDKTKPNVAKARLQGGKVDITAAAVNADGTFLVVGFADKTVRLFEVAGTAVTDTGISTEPQSFGVTTLAFSNDGQQFAIGLSSKYVVLCDIKCTVLADSWVKHTSCINDLDFSPDGKWLLSCGLEGDIGIWEMNKPKSFKPKKYFKKAHLGGVSQAKWLDNSTFFSAGCSDGAIKKWGVTL